MLKPRDHHVLIFVTGLLFCAAAASVTYVSTAQTQKEVDEGSAVESLKTDAATSPIDAEDFKTKPEIVSATSLTAAPADIKMPKADPPARTISIVGRALDARDSGRPNARITLQEADGTSHSATSDKFGNFRFEDIADAQQVILSAGDQPDPAQDLTLKLNGETRVFWRTPMPHSKTKSGK